MRLLAAGAVLPLERAQGASRPLSTPPGVEWERTLRHTNRNEWPCQRRLIYFDLRCCLSIEIFPLGKVCDNIGYMSGFDLIDDLAALPRWMRVDRLSSSEK